MKLGWLPDPFKRPDEAPDFDAEALLGATVPPLAYSNRGLVLDILDQGALNSCVANAGFQAVRASHVRQGVREPKLGSRLFGYYCSRAYHHATARDGGTHLRTFFQALNKFGLCAEDVWPYKDLSRNFKRMPPTKAFMAAFDQRSPTTYRRIYDEDAERVVAIKRALAAGFLVVFGTDVSQAFLKLQGATEPLDPPIGEPMAGGHAMCITGYDGDAFEIVNSWGSAWADGGFCRFSADYLAWSNTRDIWIVEHSPRFSE